MARKGPVHLGRVQLELLLQLAEAPGLAPHGVQDAEVVLVRERGK